MRPRTIFVAALAVLCVVVVFAAIRLGMIPALSASGGEALTSPDAPAEVGAATAESGTGPGAGAAPAGIPGGVPAADAPEDTSPAGLLVAAARAGDAHCVRKLLAGGVAADSESGGIFAIHGAADSGSVVALHFLVAAGAHLEALDQFGKSALTQAAFRGNAEAVAFLVSAGADPNAYAEPNNMTPLMALLDGWAMSLSGRSPRARSEGRGTVQRGVGAHPGRGRSAPRSQGSPAAGRAGEGHRRRNRAAVRQRPGITCPPPLRNPCAREPPSSPPGARWPSPPRTRWRSSWSSSSGSGLGMRWAPCGIRRPLATETARAPT